jgi:hypothetical protein
MQVATGLLAARAGSRGVDAAAPRIQRSPVAHRVGEGVCQGVDTYNQPQGVPDLFKIPVAIAHGVRRLVRYPH